MEKNNKKSNANKKDQGGNRPSTKPEHVNDGDETTGYGLNRKSDEEMESGAGLEEYTETKAEGDDEDEDKPKE